ncbi:MAG: VOC family protein [Carboxylicivirga sp.]|jgi:hypothetical protein|nr:VOC family protein [Carboxylicivirga sp.]
MSFKTFLVLLILTFTSYANCQEIYIDHIIEVVNDLDKTIDEYSNKGFTIKAGRLHHNGLKNAHIKFANQSSLEIMTVVGKTKDSISMQYSKLLKEGEGIVYICLSGISFDKLSSLLANKGYKYKYTKGKLWDYITFSETSELAPFFFIEYHFNFIEKTIFLIIVIKSKALEKL